MITQHRLKQLVHYDPDTGVMTWKSYRGRTAPDREIGGINHYGRRIAMVDGHRYWLARLAWLYVTGHYPTLIRTEYPDDRRWINLSWTNLKTPSGTTLKQIGENHGKGRVQGHGRADRPSHRPPEKEKRR